MCKFEEKKIKYLLHQISINNNEDDIIEIFNHSNFIFDSIAHGTYGNFRVKQYLFIYLHPEIYAKYFKQIENIKQIIYDRINKIGIKHVDIVKISIDESKLEFINTNVNIIYTPWEEINKLQDKLFDLLKISNDPIDFQNIGNTARTIMLKLSDEVFDPQKHLPHVIGHDLSKGNFKNHLHTYIDFVLSGTTNKEFRQLAEISIDYVGKSVDLMNKTTHKTDAEKHLAEVCVISTISAISIIKLINELDQH